MRTQWPAALIANKVAETVSENQISLVRFWAVSVHNHVPSQWVPLAGVTPLQQRLNSTIDSVAVQQKIRNSEFHAAIRPYLRL